MLRQQGRHGVDQQEDAHDQGADAQGTQEHHQRPILGILGQLAGRGDVGARNLQAAALDPILNLVRHLLDVGHVVPVASDEEIERGIVAGQVQPFHRIERDVAVGRSRPGGGAGGDIIDQAGHAHLPPLAAQRLD